MNSFYEIYHKFHFDIILFENDKWSTINWPIDRYGKVFMNQLVYGLWPRVYAKYKRSCASPSNVYSIRAT